jgi:adenylyl cyclase-associated protein
MASVDGAIQALLKRLETVTARLESVEKQIAAGAASGPAVQAGGGGADDGEVGASVQDFDQLVAEHITPLVQVTQTIGNAELKAQVALVEKAVQAQRQFLAVASKSKKPDDATFQKLLDSTSKLMSEVTALREKAGKVNKQFNHLSTLSEGIGALGWVAVSPTPGPFVNDARASSEFYSNKILVEFKKSDENQVKFVNSFNGFLKELFNYIKKHHTTGLTWNPRGGDASSGAAAAPPRPGCVPPPPGPPPPIQTTASSGASEKGPDTGALFAALNKGADITSGLKKVTKEQKTKYQEGKSSVVPAAVSDKPKAAPKAGGAVKKGQPKIELSGNKWLVEWQENNANIEINDTEAKHAIYIYKCENSVVRIKGKINSIAVDGCKKTGIVFQDAIAQVELVNSNSVELQVLGKVPSIAIDKCSGIQVFLSKDSLHTEIVSSKSDSMNVLIPDPSGAPDPIEIAVPEQYKTVVKNNKLVTTIVEHV